MDFIDTSIIPEGRTRKTHGEEEHNSYEVNRSSSQKGEEGKGEKGEMGNWSGEKFIAE